MDENREMIAELQAEGLVSQEHAKQLGEALGPRAPSAVGIVMANRCVSQKEAFAVLCRESHHANRKLRDVAEDLIRSYEAREE